MRLSEGGSERTERRRAGIRCLVPLVVVLLVCGCQDPEVLPSALTTSPPSTTIEWRDETVAKEIWIAGDQVFHFQISLEAGAVLKVVADQSESDVTLSLTNRNGETWDQNLIQGRYGKEQLFYRATQAEVLQVQIKGRRFDARAVLLPLSFQQFRQPSAAIVSAAKAQELTWRGIADLEGDDRQNHASLTQALFFWRESGEVGSLVAALGAFGSHLFKQGRHDQACEAWEEAEQRLRQQGCQAYWPRILVSLARAHEERGRLVRARGLLLEGLAEAERCRQSDARAYLHNQIGAFFHRRHQSHPALSHYLKALNLYRDLDFDQEQMDCLENLAASYLLAGRPREAIQCLASAQAFWQEQGDSVFSRRAQVRLSIQIGRAHFQNEQFTSALAAYDLGLRALKDDLEKVGAAGLWDAKGNAHRAKQEFEAARFAYATALEAADRAGYDSWHAHIQLNLARSLIDEALAESDQPRSRDLWDRAQALLETAHQTHLAVGSREGLIWGRFQRARLLEARGDISEARRSIEAAVHLLSDVTPSHGVMDRGLRHSRHQVFLVARRLLLAEAKAKAWPQGYDRALALHEYQASYSIKRGLAFLDSEGFDRTKVLDAGRLQAEINLLEYRREQMEFEAAPDTTQEALRRSLQVQMLRLDQLHQEKLPTAGPNPLTPVPIQALQRQLLSQEDLVLVFLLNEPRSTLWCISKETVHRFDDLAGAAMITRKARQFAAGTSAGPLPSRAQRQAFQAGQLSHALFDEARAVMEGKKRLLLVLDDGLHQVSFATLASPFGGEALGSMLYRPLVADFEVTRIGSIQTILTMARQAKSRTPGGRLMMLFGDPVYESDDARLVHQLGGKAAEHHVAKDHDACGYRHFARLGRSGEVATKLVDMIGTPNACATYLGFAATPEQFWRSQTEPFRILHFSAHGLLHGEMPELSAVVLSMWDENGSQRDGFLRALAFDQRLLPAELVVVGGCRTADGDLIQGEGVVGLSQQFLRAGSSRVVAGLWPVDEDAAAEVLICFYQELLRKGVGSAAALRTAQLEVIKRGEMHDPFYWGVFVHHGLWQTFDVKP